MAKIVIKDTIVEVKGEEAELLLYYFTTLKGSYMVSCKVKGTTKLLFVCSFFDEQLPSFEKVSGREAADTAYELFLEAFTFPNRTLWKGDSNG